MGEGKTAVHLDRNLSCGGGARQRCIKSVASSMKRARLRSISSPWLDTWGGPSDHRHVTCGEAKLPVLQDDRELIRERWWALQLGP